MPGPNALIIAKESQMSQFAYDGHGSYLAHLASINSTGEILFELSQAIEQRFGEVGIWHYRRGEDGLFPEEALPSTTRL